MNKAIVLSAMAIGSAVLLSPKIIGGNAHDNLKNLVSEIDSKPGYHLALKEEHIGWFGSVNTLHFSLDLGELAPNLTEAQRQQMAQSSFEELTFDIELALTFGPFLGTNGIGLIAWNAWIEDKPENLTILDEGVDFIYHMSGKARLSGDISYTDVIPAFEVGSAELGGKFQVSGWQGKATPVDGEIHYRGALNALTFSSDVSQVVLEGLQLDWLGEFDLATLTNRHYGKFNTELTVENVKLMDAEHTAFEMQAFSLFGDTKVQENEILDMAFGYRVSRLITPFDQFENIQLAFALNNISGDFVRKYQSLLLEYTHEHDPEAIFSALEKPFVDALEAKPEFHVTKIGFVHRGSSN